MLHIDIPQGVKLIDYGAFYACGSLMTARIPESVTEIDSVVFKNCDNCIFIVKENPYAHQWVIERGYVYTVE